MSAVSWDVVCGDAVDVLRRVRDGSIHLCVTSPPYWQLRQYHRDGQIGLEASPSAYVDRLVQVFREVRRVLRDDGVLWLNLGDCFASQGGYAAGGADGGYLAERGDGGTARRARVAGVDDLKPKDLVGIPWLAAFALRADGWYLRTAAPWVKLNPKPESVGDRLTIGHEYLFMLTKSPAYFYDVRGARRACTMRPQRRRKPHKAGKCDGVLPQQTYSTAAVRDEPGIDGEGTRQLRTSDIWRDSVAEIQAYLGEFLAGGGVLADEDGVAGVLTSTSGYKGAHFATFPTALVDPLVQLASPEAGACAACGAPWRRVRGRDCAKCGTLVVQQAKACPGCGDVRDWKAGREVLSDTLSDSWSIAGRGVPRLPGGFFDGLRDQGWRPGCECGVGVAPAVVLDPFCGSGTTGEVSISLGRSFLGIDINADYCTLARDRIARAAAGGGV